MVKFQGDFENLDVIKPVDDNKRKEEVAQNLGKDLVAEQVTQQQVDGGESGDVVLPPTIHRDKPTFEVDAPWHNRPA